MIKKSLFLLTLLTLRLIFSYTAAAGSQLNQSQDPAFREIDSLNSLGQQHLTINFAYARGYAERAGKLAKKYQYDQGKIESACIISTVLANTNHCYDALNKLDEVLPLAVATRDSLGIGKIYTVKGRCYYYLSVYDTSKQHYEKAIEIFTKTGDNRLLASAYNQLAKVYIKTGDTDKAGNYYKKALIAGETDGDLTTKAWSQDVLGEIYHAQRLYEKAISTFIKSQNEFTALKNLPGLASASLHHANASYMMIQDDSASKYYNLALATYTELGDSNGIAICFSNLSRLALETGHTEQSIHFANRALSTISGSDYKLIETATLQQLGDIYSELEQYEKAITFINRALVVAIQINHKVTIMDCYKSLSETYSAMNKSSAAYDNLLNAYRLKDSIQPIIFSKQLAEMQDQFETQKKESQIKLLEQNNQIKSFEINDQYDQINRRNIFIVSGSSIFILVVIAGYLAAQKQKLKTVIETELAIKTTEENERLRFARDVHDDLGSGLSKINFLSELIIADKIPNGVTKENAVAISETSKSLIENMRDLIWALNPENTTLANLLASIREYTSDYLEEFSAELTLSFPEQVAEMTISKESHREIFMTVKESLNNIVKHSGAERIDMTATVSSGMLMVLIQDNGAGISEKDSKQGNGLRNMKNRIESIGGSFSLVSSPLKGTTVKVAVELEKINRS